jgi:hypothetical protein
MSAIILNRSVRLTSCIRLSVALLVAVAATAAGQRAIAQAGGPLSDTLFVSAALTATPNNPNPQTLFPVTEGVNDKESIEMFHRQWHRLHGWLKSVSAVFQG